MFSIGEKVVYVNRDRNIIDNDSIDKLELNKVYTVSMSSYYIITLKETTFSYKFRANRFISLTDFRKQKINKILKRNG